MSYVLTWKETFVLGTFVCFLFGYKMDIFYFIYIMGLFFLCIIILDLFVEELF